MIIKSIDKQTRPELNKNISAEVFSKFYWNKVELVSFCSIHGLSTTGGKISITKRIEFFLKTGKIKNPQKTKTTIAPDSKMTITRETIVINYKNDAKTRSFFEKAIGTHFYFNSYLRQFAKFINVDSKITYGHLVDGWINEESNKKNPNYKSTIGEQFKFNRFQRDFYAVEKGKTRKEFIKAWQLVRSVSGNHTYEHYLKLIKKQKPDR